MKKELTKIAVETVANGYVLKVDNQEYLFFNALELLEGMFVHVGLNKKDYLDKKVIKDLMTAAATWPNAEDAVLAAATLTADIEKLKRDLTTANHKIGKQQERIDHLQDILDERAPKAKSRKKKDIESMVRGV